MEATIVDLRYRMKDVLAAVERGESITILHRGTAKAKLVPLEAKQAKGKLQVDKAFGLWRDREDVRDVPKFVHKLRRPRDFRH